MALDFYRVGDIVPCIVSVTEGDAAGENVRIVAICETRQGRQEKVLRDSLAGLKVTGDQVTFEWDTTGAVPDDELYRRYTIEVRGSQLWGRKTVVVRHPDIEVAGVDRHNSPVEGARCRVSIKPDAGFAAAGFNFDDLNSEELDDRPAWTSITDKAGLAIFKHMPLGDVQIDWIKPHVLTKTGWKVEGKYAKTGPWRKAEIRKVPRIEVVSWGQPGGGLDAPGPVATANAAAALETLVTYWRRSPEPAGKLSEEIVDRPWPSADALIADQPYLTGSFLMGRRASLDRMIAALAGYELYPVIQLLMQLVVLYLEGGYSVDARAALSNGGTVEGLPDPERIRLIGANESIRLRRWDRTSHGTCDAGPELAKSTDVREGKTVETYVMAAPPRNTAVLAMIASLVQRLEHLNIDQNPAEIWLHNEEMNADTALRLPSSNEHAARLRQRILFNLLQCPIQEGLEWLTATGAPPAEIVSAAAFGFTAP